MPETMDDRLAALTVRDYVCSNCWGHLLKFPTPDGMWRVECARCEGDTRGYVTKFYASKRLAESRADKLDVRENLRGLGILPPTPAEIETPEEMLKSLGF